MGLGRHMHARTLARPTRHDTKEAIKLSSIVDFDIPLRTYNTYRLPTCLFVDQYGPGEAVRACDNG